MIHTHIFASTMLNSCSYDDEEKEMIVAFSNGKDYIYENVPPEIYRMLISAESAGRYFNSVKSSLTVKK